jgi:hypothetical protein
LITPISADASLEARLAELVELSTRRLLPFLRASEEVPNHWQQEFNAELKRIADDPARGLATRPETEGGKAAREFLCEGAGFASIDTETRQGAVKLGDFARKQLDSKPKRKGWNLTCAEHVLFDDIVDWLAELAPEALDPSNFPNKERLEIRDDWPPILFARNFIEIVVDRCRERDCNLPQDAEERLTGLLNKSDRALLERLISARQSYRRHRDLFEDGVTTQIITGAGIFF